MPDPTTIELRYSGKEVEDGAVPVEDMIDALAGFSGAYNKIARRAQPEIRQRLRVVAVRKGSAKILIDVVQWIANNPQAAGVWVTAGGMVGTGAYMVLKDLVGVIKAKKALHGQTVINNNYTFNDNRNVLPVGLQLTPQQFHFLQTGELDPDLDRMTRPLERRINDFQLKVGDEELVKVSVDERPYFTRHRESLASQARGRLKPARTEYSAALEGTFRSHNKRTNSGKFELVSGQTIRYRYRNRDIHPLLRAYASTGVVKVFGTVKYDQDGEPISIDIRDIELRQEAGSGG